MIAVYLTDKLQFYNIFTKTTTISEFGFENNYRKFLNLFKKIIKKKWKIS